MLLLLSAPDFTTLRTALPFEGSTSGELMGDDAFPCSTENNIGKKPIQPTGKQEHQRLEHVQPTAHVYRLQSLPSHTYW